MADRVPFLVRLDPEIMAALKRWANDDLRSLNAEIEFLLRRSLVQAHRMPAPGGPGSGVGAEGGAAGGAVGGQGAAGGPEDAAEA